MEPGLRATPQHKVILQRIERVSAARRNTIRIPRPALQDRMKRSVLAGIILFCGAAQAAPAHQDWSVSHQPDRFMDRVLMEAWADADKGPARMTLYCDTESGFRVMFMPHRALMPEGPGRITLTIDGAKPMTLN